MSAPAEAAAATLLQADAASVLRVDAQGARRRERDRPAQVGSSTVPRDACAAL